MSDIQYRNTFPEKRNHNSIYRERGEWRSKPRIVLIVGEPTVRTKKQRTKREPAPRVEPRSDSLKLCTTCGERLPIGCFGKSKKSPDGHVCPCKVCREARRAELENGAERCRPWQRQKRAKEGRAST